MNSQRSLSIAHCFNKAVDSYSEVAHIQKICAHNLVKDLHDTLSLFVPATILDIGSGSGYVVEELLLLFAQSQYYINDIAQNMMNITQNKWGQDSRFTFLLADMDALKLNFFSLITANFSLQWSINLPKLLTYLYRHTQVLSFTCLLHGTFIEWTNLLSALDLPHVAIDYPTADKVQQWIKQLNPKNYTLRAQSFTLTFEHPLAFMQYLKDLGANHTEIPLSIKAIKRLLAYSQSLSVTYHVLFVMLY
jgi:malonyl-CoA O-methyltransferase